MPRLLNPDIAYRKVLKGKAPARTKLKVLAAMVKPSSRFLRWLVGDPGTHPKVRALAGVRLAELEEVRSAVPGAKGPLPASKDADLWAEFERWRESHPEKVETVRKTNRDGTETEGESGTPSGIAPDAGNPAPADRSIARCVLSRLTGEASSEPPAEKAIRASVQTQPAERTTQPIPESKPTAEVAGPVLSAEACFECDDWLKRQRLLIRQQRALLRQTLENETTGGYDRAENRGRFNVPTPSPEPKPVRRDPDLSRWIDPRFSLPDLGQISPRRQEPEFSPEPTASNLRRSLLQIAKEIADGSEVL